MVNKTVNKTIHKKRTSLYFPINLLIFLLRPISLLLLLSFCVDHWLCQIIILLIRIISAEWIQWSVECVNTWISFDRINGQLLFINITDDDDDFAKKTSDRFLYGFFVFLQMRLFARIHRTNVPTQFEWVWIIAMRSWHLCGSRGWFPVFLSTG